jgi:hypothetical protein
MAHPSTNPIIPFVFGALSKKLTPLFYEAGSEGGPKTTQSSGGSLPKIVIGWLPNFVTHAVTDWCPEFGNSKSRTFCWFLEITAMAHPLLLDGRHFALCAAPTS